MKERIIIADNSPRDVQRFRSLIEDAGLNCEHYSSGAELSQCLDSGVKDLAAIILLWEIPGPPFGSELLIRAHRLLSDVPIVVVSDALDASIATRAFRFGARDFLEKPLDMQRVQSWLISLFDEANPDSPLIEKLSETILGKSPALVTMLRQMAKVIERKASRILLVGESGTGKELLAQSIHKLSYNPGAPFVAVNVAAIPKELIESELFGHEKGAFTGASETHLGYMEEAADGTLFLDEIGELDLSLQVKLLRVLQENKFRRLKSKREIEFRARVVSATNRDLTQAVTQGAFRQDLFHRINQVTVNIPALRERAGDIDLLLDYFLSIYGGNRQVRFARETLSILRSYPFSSGNIRELENFVKRALIECDGELILPQHLPLSTMGDFLTKADEFSKNELEPEGRNNKFNDQQSGAHDELFNELLQTLPENWRDLPYKQALEYYERAFDRVYLPNLIENHRHNVTKATKSAGVDKKTFAQHWKNAGLPPLRSSGGSEGGEESNE